MEQLYTKELSISMHALVMQVEKYLEVQGMLMKQHGSTLPQLAANILAIYLVTAQELVQKINKKLAQELNERSNKF